MLAVMLVWLAFGDVKLGINPQCGGIATALHYKQSVDLLNHNRGDCGREWQFAIFEGYWHPDGGAETLYVAASQGAGNFGKVKNPVWVSQHNDRKYTSSGVMLDYNPLRYTPFPYRNEHYKRYKYPKTAWFMETTYEIVDVNVVRFRFKAWTDDGKPRPVKLAAATVFLEWPGFVMLNEQNLNTDSFQGADLLDDAILLVRDGFMMKVWGKLKGIDSMLRVYPVKSSWRVLEVGSRRAESVSVVDGEMWIEFSGGFRREDGDLFRIRHFQD